MPNPDQKGVARVVRALSEAIFTNQACSGCSPPGRLRARSQPTAFIGLCPKSLLGCLLRCRLSAETAHFAPQDGVLVCKIVTRGLISKTPEEVAALQIRSRI